MRKLAIKAATAAGGTLAVLLSGGAVYFRH